MVMNMTSPFGDAMIESVVLNGTVKIGFSLLEITARPQMRSEQNISLASG